MHDQPAKHYLDIYQARLKMIEKGILKPRPEVVAGLRRLVSGLSVVQPDASIRLEAPPGKAIFKMADSGALIAEIDFHVEA